ncbi:MAG TPA: hypothetical protein VHE13_16660 [Opitutus sp.]|nr:hypothetical protein [Opitutus sp.]
MLAAVVTKDPTTTTTTETTIWTTFEAWPQWLQVLTVTVVAVIALWIFAKIVKWSLYILIWLILIGGLAATAWLLLK